MRPPCNGERRKMKKLGKQRKTGRGFPIINFKDHYGAPCSLQASSLAIYDQPGTSAVWLGCDDAQPKVLASEAAKCNIETQETSGSVPYPIPEEVSLTTRMHLDRGQVEALIGHLQAWLDSGIGEFEQQRHSLGRKKKKTVVK